VPDLPGSVWRRGEGRARGGPSREVRPYAWRGMADAFLGLGAPTESTQTDALVIKQWVRRV
jgi:hypothetical protein